MTYKNIFFDLDHTLWDFDNNSRETLAIIYEELQVQSFLDIAFDDFHPVYKEINKKYWERYRKGFIKRSDLRWKRMQATFIQFKKSNEELAHKMGERYLELLPNQTTLFPHALNVLEHCKRKELGIHMITNGFSATQQKKMIGSGIAHFFSEVITSENAMSLKPKAEIFDYAFKQTQADPASSIMIGDNLDVDILGARNAQMDQVYFNPERVQHADEPTFEIHCLSELLEIL